MAEYTLTAGPADSQTDFAAGFAVRPSDTWVAVCAELLGENWIGRGFGISGNRTDQALALDDVIFQYDTPTVNVLPIGVNDPGTLTTSQTQINLQAMILAARHRAVGKGAGLGAGVSVANPAALPAGGRKGQRYVVLTDDSTTGGVAAWDASHAATVTGTVTADGNGQKITVWENRYPLAGANGWGRIAKRGSAPSPDGVPKIVVVTPPYRNFTTGGDTPSTPLSVNADIRTAMQAAVTAENTSVGGAASVIFCDLYAWMRQRIVDGVDLDFSTVSHDQTRSWHYTQNNQHYSAYGHSLQAQKVAVDIKATWPSLFA